MNACAADLVACLTFSAIAQFGNAQYGLVIVMGWGNSIGGSASGFRGLLESFLGQTHYGCLGESEACASMVLALLDAGASTTAVYDIMGVKFIEADPGGLRVLGALSHAFGIGDQGAGELSDIMNDPRGKEIRAVYGFSLGAETVARYFVRQSKMGLTPFFLDSPPGVTAVAKAFDLPNSAGGYAFSDHDWGTGFLGHKNHTGIDAAYIADRLAECYEALNVSGVSC